MNDLIIIGNGFDLAHGLNTRYSDFILDYLNSVYKLIYDGNSHDDPLIIVDDMFNGLFNYPDTISSRKQFTDRLNSSAANWKADYGLI